MIIIEKIIVLKSILINIKKRSIMSANFCFLDLYGLIIEAPIKLSDDIMMGTGVSSKMLEIVPYLLGDKDYLVKEIEKNIFVTNPKNKYLQQNC